MKPFFLMLCCALFTIASCEDKKSSKEKTGDPAMIDTTAPALVDVKIPGENKTEEPLPEGPLIVQEELIPFLTKYGKENPEDKVRISTRFGDIDVELFHDTPLHRAMFVLLVKEGYYDNTFFHRVAEGFVIQGGNSDNPETNKKRHYFGDFLIPSEFDAGHRHVRGSLAAAKYAEQNVSKASSPYEFYIVQDPDGAPHLNNDHTVFGRVISGMDVVDEINKVETDQSEWPLTNIHIQAEVLE